MVALTRAGAFTALGVTRRDGLWTVSGTSLRRRAAAAEDSGTASLLPDNEPMPEFGHLTDFESVAWDYTTAADVSELPDGARATSSAW